MSEEEKPRVSVKLGTKLLLGVVSLILIVIIFLNVATTLLIQEDKQAYIYQTQSIESTLAGNEFINLAEKAMGTLRTVLSRMNPSRAISPGDNAALKTTMENQNQLLAATVELLDPSSGEMVPYAKSLLGPSVKKLGLQEFEFEVPGEMVQRNLGSLKEKGFAFFNLSKAGVSPVVALAIADLGFKGAGGKIPVATGFYSLGEFGQELQGSALTIADHAGWILFDSSPENLLVSRSVSLDPFFKDSIQSKLAKGAKEFQWKKEQYLGSYSKPGLDLLVMTRTSWRSAMRSTYELAEKYILMGMFTVGIAIIFAIVFSKQLTSPLSLLYVGTKQVGEGNFNLNLDVQSKDEIGALTKSFNVMARQINGLIDDKVERTRMEGELEIASTVQSTLFPPKTMENDFVKIVSHNESASECGGDWMGFYEYGSRILVAIADATGHGIPSALITATAHSCFSVVHQLSMEGMRHSPASIMQFANRAIHDAARGKIMMTFFVGIFDFETKEFHYSNAGHNPPWLYVKKGESYKPVSLMTKGQRLGESVDRVFFQEKKMALKGDEILFLYTDGITEGVNKEDEQWGKKRLRRVLQNSVSKGPDFITQDVMIEFQEFIGMQPLEDDVTMATVYVKPLEIS